MLLMPLVPHTNQMTNLSPAAQLVWDAFCGAPICAEVKLAAALRAAADHVVAEDALYARSCCEFVGSDCRSQLLAIADELGLNG